MPISGAFRLGAHDIETYDARLAKKQDLAELRAILDSIWIEP
jgi:hypothetical protein